MHASVPLLPSLSTFIYCASHHFGIGSFFEREAEFFLLFYPIADEKLLWELRGLLPVFVVLVFFPALLRAGE